MEKIKKIALQGFRMKNGGERGIRTLGGAFTPHSLSRRAPSASSAISPKMIVFLGKSGGSRIRTHGALTLNGFQDRRLQPLGHPSKNFFFISMYPPICQLKILL